MGAARTKGHGQVLIDLGAAEREATVSVFRGAVVSQRQRQARQGGTEPVTENPATLESHGMSAAEPVRGQVRCLRSDHDFAPLRVTVYGDHGRKLFSRPG